jgi:hypothetical protein
LEGINELWKCPFKLLSIAYRHLLHATNLAKRRRSGKDA